MERLEQLEVLDACHKYLPHATNWPSILLALHMGGSFGHKAYSTVVRFWLLQRDKFLTYFIFNRQVVNDLQKVMSRIQVWQNIVDKSTMQTSVTEPKVGRKA